MKPRGALHHGKRVANKVYKRVTELSWQRLRLSDCRRFRDIASCRKSPILTYLTCIWRLRWGWPRLSFTEIFGVGRKEGDDVPLSRWGLGPRLTPCGLGRGLLPYQVASWSIQPFGHNTHEPKIGWGRALFFWGSWVPIEHKVTWALFCLFHFFLFGAHVRAVFLPLSPASTVVCNCFSHFGLLLVFRLFFSFIFCVGK